MLLITVAIFLNYIDRGAIGIAAPLMKTELGLSATRFGVAVSAFFWVYAPIQLLIGRMCDRLPVYRVYGAGVALWAASTLLTGFVGGVVSLLCLRVLLGIGESVAFPGSSKMIARHVPQERRGLANAAVGAALAIGPAAGTLCRRPDHRVLRVARDVPGLRAADIPMADSVGGRRPRASIRRGNAWRRTAGPCPTSFGTSACGRWPSATSPTTTVSISCSPGCRCSSSSNADFPSSR